MKPQGDTEKTTGTRCHICTGCGRCTAALSEKQGLRVLTGTELSKEAQPIISKRRERLVTADIGTTTVALQLFGQDGSVTADHTCVNPQVKYGADVLARIQAAQTPGSREDMREMIRGEIRNALQRFAPCLEEGESMRMVLAGNTTMVYLLLGYDPAELGRAPFHVTYPDAVTIPLEGVPCHIFPAQSAFVGGDITAGIYACGMHEAKELTLLIDLGTNGEMALGNEEKILACSTAAGPAFEGGVNRGVWGADMVSILARLLREGAMDETGLLADAYFDAGVRIHDVCVTQQSVRALQLAKAAIAAGIKILAGEYGIGEDGLDKIGKVVLAGGFGYYLDPKDAADIGLLPRELAHCAAAGGNTALSGCLRAGRQILQAEDAGAEAEALLSGMQAGGPWNLRVINLAQCGAFEQYYMDSINFGKA